MSGYPVIEIFAHSLIGSFTHYNAEGARLGRARRPAVEQSGFAFGKKGKRTTTQAACNLSRLLHSPISYFLIYAEIQMIHYLLIDSATARRTAFFRTRPYGGGIGTGHRWKTKVRHQRWKLIWRSSHWALRSFFHIDPVCRPGAYFSGRRFRCTVAGRVELLVGPLMIWLGMLAIRRNFKKMYIPLLPMIVRSAARSGWAWFTGLRARAVRVP